MVEALLQEYQASAKNNSLLLGSYKDYCIMESWKNFKHILPPSLKMLKLLKSRGATQMNVSFYLLKTCTLNPCSMWWTSQQNIAPGNYSNHYNTAFHVQAFPLDMRKRIVRKTFRKLAKMKKDMDCPKENNIQQLIYIIMFQENIIKQQMGRMEQLNNQLEARESFQQTEKFGCNGENIVSCMNADEHGFYSVDRFPEMHNLENLMHIQEKLNYQHTLIRKLSGEINVEMSSMCTQEEEDCVEEGYTDMETSVKQEIDESLQIGLRLHSLYSYIQKEIQYNDAVLLHQKREYEILKDELNAVCARNSSCSLYYTPQQYMYSDVSSSKEEPDITALLSSMDIQNDTDSDTGISSTHSQDSETVQ